MVKLLADLDHEPVVGEFYMVPTVSGVWNYRPARAWPVLLPGHTDAEIVNFPHFHYHLDTRFLPQFLEDSLYRATTAPLMTYERLNPGGLPEPVLRRRRCQRRQYDMSWLPKKSGWPQELQKAFRRQTLKPGRVCPHKGICLKSQPVVDGVVTCPGHGLRWNVETGKLVTSDLHTPLRGDKR